MNGEDNTLEGLAVGISILLLILFMTLWIRETNQNNKQVVAINNAVATKNGASNIKNIIISEGSDVLMTIVYIDGTTKTIVINGTIRNIIKK